MSRAALTTLAGVAALLVASCDQAPAAKSPQAARPAAGAAGYLPPPVVTGGTWTARGVTLTGTATAGASVNLASPSGARVAGAVDSVGRWSAILPAEAAPAIYGLSMELNGRAIQAEGYLLLTPDGRVRQLRAGAGARQLAGPPLSGLTALDYDGGGSVIVSGQVRPDTPVAVAVDGRPAMQSRSAADGHVSVLIAQPLSPGPHTITLASEAKPAQSAAVNIDDTAAAVAAPMRATATDGGWRIDWLTPGGGVQTTLLLG